MELKELGKTGLMVPEIGVGTWKYSGGVEPLQTGIDLGAWLIDTAEIYRTEGVVGQAIASQRSGIFLATKVSGDHLRTNEVMRAADASLRLLDTDYIDLYQIHWPNRRVPIAETMGAIETLVDRGLVKYIGVSNFSLSELREAQAAMTRYPHCLQPGAVQPDRPGHREGPAALLPGTGHHCHGLHPACRRLPG